MTIDRFENDKPCRVLVFTSANAGSGRNREQIGRLSDQLDGLQIEWTLHNQIGDLVQQATSASRTHQVVVVAAGGDGTISLAAAAIDAEIPIVPMPLGTENLLARQFGHRAAAESVLETIRHGSSYRLDAGTANGRPFLIMATCGFDAEVVRAMHLTRRGHIRRLSYLRPILRAMRQYQFPPIHVTIDGDQSLECCWAMVFNLPQYGGGLKIEPRAVGNDGELDVIAFKRGSIATGMKYAAGIWLGRHLMFRDVTRHRGRVIEITSQGRVPFQLDGDYAGRLPLRIETKPGQVHLLLPPAS